MPDSGARHLLGPGTCWGRARFASNAGRQVLDSGARHLLGLSQDLLAMLGDRCRIQVPGSRIPRAAPPLGSGWLRLGSGWLRLARSVGSEMLEWSS
jgi:hypothetical protein